MERQRPDLCATALTTSPFTPSCSALLTVPYLTTCYLAQSTRYQNSIVWLQTTLSSYRQLQPFDI